MKKIAKYISLIFILTIGYHTDSKGQCDITATAIPGTVCAGGKVFLTSTGSCGYLMNNDFNNGTIGTGWSSTAANPVFTNPCGPGPNGTHLWVGTTASQQRTLITNSYDVSIGGCTIDWFMRYGLVPGSGPCEDPDAANEGVHLQYSTNNGATWTDFPGPNISPMGPNSTTGPFITNTNGSGGYWQPESSGSVQQNSTLYHWHSYQSVIPPVASTTNTKFRWAQLANSNAGWDAWGIDEVGITCPNSSIHVLWSTGDTVFNPGQVTLPPHPNNLAYDTCFIVQVWDSLNPQGAYDTVCIHVLPVPTSDFTVSDTVVCEYDSVHINYTGSAPSNAIYSWNIEGNILNNQGPIDTIFTPGVYSAKLTVNQGGCISSQTTQNIFVNPKPLLSFSPSVYVGCEPLNVVFNNYSSPANSVYLWNLGDGDTSHSVSPNHTYLSNGIYTVSLNATTPEGCYDTMSISNLIHVYPKPVANAIVNPNVSNIDNPNFQFTDLSQLANSWHWDFGDGNTSDSQNPYYSYAAVGETYTVWLVVKSDKGCIDSTQLIVRVIVDKIEVPNIITPNGDGSNDKFVIKNIEMVESSQVLIFNRWGKKVYESNNYQNDWDGDNLADGVYFYVIRYKTFLDEFEEKGSVTIMRK
jgi:gliding motility-associated-like protein